MNSYIWIRIQSVYKKQILSMQINVYEFIYMILHIQIKVYKSYVWIHT